MRDFVISIISLICSVALGSFVGFKQFKSWQFSWKTFETSFVISFIGLLSLQDSDKLQSLLNHELWLEDGEYGRQSLADQDYVVGRLGVEERPLDMEDRFEWIRRACFVEMFGNRKNPELFAFFSESNSFIPKYSLSKFSK